MKHRSSAESAAHEAQRLAAVQGGGVVPLRGGGAPGELVLAEAACSLADVLHERGPLPEDEVRAVGAAAAAALARVHAAGLVHGDVKPANLLLSHDRELWLADFDAAAPADGQPLARQSPGRVPPDAAAVPSTDTKALALALVELATGTLLDPGVAWRASDLRRLGCSPALSAEIALMLGASTDTGTLADRAAASDLCGCPGPPGPAAGVAAMLQRGAARDLPVPAERVRGVDSTPTVEFMPARPPPGSSPRPAPKTGTPASRWWQRLAASWRPGGATPTRCGPSPTS